MAINPTFAGFLEEEPRAAFFGTLGKQGMICLLYTSDAADE